MRPSDMAACTHERDVRNLESEDCALLHFAPAGIKSLSSGVLHF